MNVFIMVMVAFSMLGLVDKAIGNKMNLANSFDQGLAIMGTLTLSMAGFYCVAVTFIQNNIGLMETMSSLFHIEPSMISGILLAPDMGGYHISNILTQDANVLILTGVLASSSIGTILSFSLPLSVSILRKEDIASFSTGLIYGLISIALCLIIFSMFLGISFWVIVPVVIVCVILLAGLVFVSKQTIRFVGYIGSAMKVLTYILFGIVVLQLYFNLHYFDEQLIQDCMVMMLKCAIIMSGSLVLSELILRVCRRQRDKLTARLGINSYSLIGIVLSCTTAIAMLPLYSKMDNKGKIINSAFSVTGAYFLGSQFAFIYESSTSYGVFMYVLFKVLTGIFAIFIALLIEKYQTKTE